VSAGRLPTVAIVGRPNVGKSTLLNCLARQRIAIVDPTSGVTRDRVSAIIAENDHMFELWDTGGVGLPEGHELAAEVAAQIDVAVHHADLILFVVDAQAGLMPLDGRIASDLRAVGKPILLVANKVDHARHELAVPEFHALGLGSPVPVSARERMGRRDLMSRILAILPRASGPAAEPVMKLAVVGQRNVGKSTLINHLAHEERMIVSEVPGTTRDSVDVRFECNGRIFVAIDTAGVRRKKSVRNAVEFYSMHRAERSIRRSDVVLFLLDAAREIASVDKKLARYVQDQARPCVLVVNKWDLARGLATEEYTRYLESHLRGPSYAPISFVSGLTGRNVKPTIALAQDLFDQSRYQVTTGELNRVIKVVQDLLPGKRSSSHRPRILYGVQVRVAPPTFVMFTARPHLVTDRYARQIANALRKHLPFQEVPLRIYFRARPRRTARSAAARGRA